MSQQVTITITAKDGSSQTFQAIGRAAQGMASTAQTAGQQAADGIAKIDKQASITEGNLGKLGKGFDVVKGAAAGLVGSAVVGFLSDSARAAADSEVIMGRLQIAVDNTGKAFSDLQPALDDAISGAEGLAFDGEDAAGALTILTNNTGDANKALDLLGLTMDIARGRGVDLATAAAAVGKAADGNVGALSRMGVAVAEGASAQQALASAQATFAGQAEGYASTTQGAFDRLTVTFGNFQESIGGMLGPAQTLIGILPGLTSGFGLVGSAVGGLSGAGGFAGMVAALNPAVLAIGALAVGIGVVTAAMISAQGTVREYNSAIADVTATAMELADPALAQGLAGWAISLEEAASAYPLAAMGGKDFGKAVTEYDKALADSMRTTADAGGSLGDFSTLVSGIDRDLHDNVGTVRDATEALADYRAIMADTSPAGNAARDTLALLNRELADGTIHLPEYNREVDRLANEFLPKWADAATNAGGKSRELASSIVGTRDEYDRLVTSTDTATKAQQDAWEASDRLAESYRSQLVPQIQGAGEAFGNLAIPGEDVLDLLNRLGGSMPGINEQFAGLVDGLNNSALALDGVLGTFSQIDSLGDRAQSAVDIAQSVVGDPGVYATVDDLLANGRITLEEYNRAQADEVAIVSTVAGLQEDLNVLRFNQIGALQTATSGYATYISKLAEAPQAEQAVALAMMDTGIQAQVAAGYSATYSATLGEIPRDVATQIVADAAAADPVLFDVYEKLGLISQGADGTIIVNFPDQSQIALDKFSAAFGADAVTKTADGLIEVRQSDGTTLVYDQFNNLVDKQVTASVNVDLNDPAGLLARGGGGAAANDINAAAMNLESQAVTISVTADSSDFDNTLAAARESADTLAATTFTAEIAGDAQQWDSTLAATTEAGTVFGETLFVAELGGDAQQWTSTLDATTEAGTTFGETLFVAELGGDSAQWAATLGRAIDDGEAFGATTFLADLDADTRNFDARIAQLRGSTIGTVYMEVEPIDSNKNAGMQLGGTVRSESVSSLARIWPTGQNGRTILVGEAGPELAFLPLGTQIMPSGASRSRMASDANSGGMRFYGPVHIHAATPDIAREIQRQLATRSRA